MMPRKKKPVLPDPPMMGTSHEPLPVIFAACTSWLSPDGPAPFGPEVYARESIERLGTTMHARGERVAMLIGEYRLVRKHVVVVTRTVSVELPPGAEP